MGWRRVGRHWVIPSRVTVPRGNIIYSCTYMGYIYGLPGVWWLFKSHHNACFRKWWCECWPCEWAVDEYGHERSFIWTKKYAGSLSVYMNAEKVLNLWAYPTLRTCFTIMSGLMLLIFFNKNDNRALIYLHYLLNWWQWLFWWMQDKSQWQI